MNQHQRQAIPGPVHAGVALQGAAKRRPGIFMAPGLLQQIAQVEPGRRRLRPRALDAGELLQTRDRFFKMIQLCLHMGPAGERIAVRGVALQHLVKPEQCAGPVSDNK